MNIEIHTYDRKLTTDLFGKNSVSSDDETQISNDARLRFKGIISYKAFDIPKIVMFALKN